MIAHFSGKCNLSDALGPYIVAVVVALAEAVDPHAAAAAGGGVDEVAVADVDAHVGAGLAVAPGGVAEEHQIAGLQVRTGHGGAGGAVPLGGGGVGEVVAVLIVYVHREAGAVKALGGRAAVHVAGAQVLLGGGHHVRAQAAAGHAVIDPQEVGADVAQLAVDGDGVPAVFHVQQVHQIPGVNLGHNRAVGGGNAADVDAVAGDDAPGVHQGDAVDGDVIGLDIALLALIGGVAPLVGDIDDGQLVAGPHLGEAEIIIFFRQMPFVTRMTMPKASVNKYGLFQAHKYKIRLTL